jgi:hypothetical protein
MHAKPQYHPHEELLTALVPGAILASLQDGVPFLMRIAEVDPTRDQMRYDVLIRRDHNTGVTYEISRFASRYPWALMDETTWLLALIEGDYDG